LHSSIPPLANEPTLDVVVVRPFRDPSVKDESDETKARFAEKSGAVLGAAYRDGIHIDIKYGEDGSLIEGGADGPSVVEYYRVGEWEWVPDDTDDAAHFVCVDGEIFQLHQFGRAICSVQNEIKGVEFSVFV